MAARRKIEVEMKYEVATPRRRRSLPGGARARAVRLRRAGPLGPHRRPLRRLGRLGPGSRRLRRPDAQDLARHGDQPQGPGTLGRAGCSAARRSRARPTRHSIPSDWPASQARTVIMELCGDAALVELLTIRQLRRDPAAHRRRHAGRTQPRRGRGRRPGPRPRHLRGTGGGAQARRRGPTRTPGGRARSRQGPPPRIQVEAL